MRLLTTLAAIASAFAFASAAAAAPEPPGSYQRSCHDIYADWTTLSATCRTTYGGENYSTLRNYRDCRGDIANVHGRLQCIDDDQDDDDDDWLPRGSYRDSCRSERVTGDTLMAECRDQNGRWRYTELANFRSCEGDIYNANGILACRRGGGDDDHDDDGALPGGNWRYTCRNARVYGRILYAECRDSYGTWRATSLDLLQCQGEVANLNGRLACGPVGSYGRITLYRHAHFIGTKHTFTTSVRDLNRYDFGNVASSVVVQGGLWELCDRPNFAGRCIIVSRTQSNLRSYGFTDRAESVRRLR
jgi:hypothetical protein